MKKEHLEELNKMLLECNDEGLHILLGSLSNLRVKENVKSAVMEMINAILKVRSEEVLTNE